MPDQTPANARLLEFHNREMEYLRLMVSNGVTVAIPAALQYCHEHKCPVPDWLLKTSTELLCDLLKSERPKRRGRAATVIARYRQDTIDYSRWGTVIWQREAQQELLKQVEDIKSWPGNVPAKYREDREQLQKWLGTTLERAFECSAMLLEGTESFGSPDAIKRSYFKVVRNIADPKQAMTYHLLDPRFLQKLGIKWEPFVRPGRKIEPLYKLSLGPR